MPKKEIRFHIEGTTPQMLPMARLAEYIKELAALCGHKKQVHFMRVETGSAPLVMEVDEEVEQKVYARIERARSHRGPLEAREANNNLRLMLKKDSYWAEFKTADGEVRVTYPLLNEERQKTFGPFWQEGFIDGIVVRLGGIDDTLPVHLVFEGRVYICNASRDIVKQLGPKIWGDPIRAFGRGKWYRNEQGVWEMQYFNIHGIGEVRATTLSDAVQRLRNIPDNEITQLKDPLREMQKIRHGE